MCMDYVLVDICTVMKINIPECACVLFAAKFITIPLNCVRLVRLLLVTVMHEIQC